MTFLLYGYSGAGKSTLINSVREELVYTPCILCPDYLRKTINLDLGYQKEDRTENIRRTAHIANLMDNLAETVLVSLMCPTKADRALFKSITGAKMIYVKCTMADCIVRDPKGLYDKYLKNEITNIPGLDMVYEEPDLGEYDLIINTSEDSELDCCMQLFYYVSMFQAEEELDEE